MLLIKGARIITMEENDFEKGDILIGDDGKIAAIGENVKAPEGAEVLDASGLTACPGFIDAHTHIGIFENAMGFEGSDGNEMTDPVTPQMRAIDAINPVDPCFSEALRAGVTTVCVGPGSANVISGQFSVMKTCGSSIAEMTVDECAALKTAFGENPKRVYSGQKKMPSTRMGTAAVFRQAFVDAQAYARKMEAADADKTPDRNLGKEVMVRALSGGLRVKCHAHRADDILTAIRLCREFNLDFSIEHCTEGYMVAETLKKENIPIIIGPLLSDRSKIELSNLTFTAPAKLHAAGVRFAMMTDHPVIPEEYLPVCAMLAMREGLPEREALACITINAAWALKMDDTLGSLKQGKDADIALFDRHPLDIRAHAQAVIVGGKIVHKA